MEVLLAKLLGKPVVALTFNVSNVSPWLLYYSDYVVPNVEDVQTSELEKLNQRTMSRFSDVETLKYLTKGAQVGVDI